MPMLSLAQFSPRLFFIFIFEYQKIVVEAKKFFDLYALNFYKSAWKNIFIDLNKVAIIFAQNLSK